MSIPTFITQYIRQLYPDVDVINNDEPLREWVDNTLVHTPPHMSRTYLEHAIVERSRNKTIILLMKTSVLGTNYFPLVGPCELVFFNHRLLFPGYNRRAPFSSMLVVLKPFGVPSSWSVLCVDEAERVCRQIQHLPALPPSPSSSPKAAGI